MSHNLETCPIVMAQLRDKRAGRDVRKAWAVHHFVAAHVLAAMVQYVFALGYVCQCADSREALSCPHGHHDLCPGPDLAPAQGAMFIFGKVTASPEIIAHRKAVLGAAGVDSAKTKLLLETVPGRQPNQLVFKRKFGVCGCHFGPSSLVRSEHLVWPGPGPLHMKLNAIEDIVRNWRGCIFERMTLALTGRVLRKAVLVRQSAYLLECLQSAWAAVRGVARPRLLALYPRFDAAALLWMLEVELPQAVLSYDVLALENLTVEYNKSKVIATVGAVVRNRRNYQFGLVSELGQLEYCCLHQPELYDALYNGAGTPLDEGFSDGGINSAAARVTNAWQDPAEGRRQMLLHFANTRNNNDLVTFLTQGQHL